MFPAKEIKWEDRVRIYCAVKRPLFLVPQFIRGPSHVAKENEPLLFEIFRVKFFQLLRIQPRGESVGDSRDVPEPIRSLYAVEWGS